MTEATPPTMRFVSLFCMAHFLLVLRPEEQTGIFPAWTRPTTETCSSADARSTGGQYLTVDLGRDQMRDPGSEPCREWDGRCRGSTRGVEACISAARGAGLKTKPRVWSARPNTPRHSWPRRESAPAKLRPGRSARRRGDHCGSSRCGAGDGLGRAGGCDQHELGTVSGQTCSPWSLSGRMSPVAMVMARDRLNSSPGRGRATPNNGDPLHL